MAPHSSVLAWRIPGMGEPGGLPSMGSHSQTRLKWLSSSSSKHSLKVYVLYKNSSLGCIRTLNNERKRPSIFAFSCSIQFNSFSKKYTVPAIVLITNAFLRTLNESCSVVSDSCNLWGSSAHGDSPGKNTRVSCHALLQGIFPTQGLNPGLPHCLQILYHLSHQGSPLEF